MPSSTKSVRAPAQTPRVITPVPGDVGDRPHVDRGTPTPELDIFGNINDVLDSGMIRDMEQQLKKKDRELEDLREKNRKLVSWGHQCWYHAEMADKDVKIEEQKLLTSRCKRAGDVLLRKERERKKKRDELRAARGASEVDSEEDKDAGSAANPASDNTRQSAVDERSLSHGRSASASETNHHADLSQGRDSSDSITPVTASRPNSETSRSVKSSPNSDNSLQRTSMTEDAIGRIIGPDNIKLVVVQVFLNRFQPVLRREILEVLRDVLDRNKGARESYSLLIQRFRGCFNFSALVREVDQVSRMERTSVMYSKYKWNFYYIHGEPHPDVPEEVAMLPQPFGGARKFDSYCSDLRPTMKAFLRLRIALSDPCCIHRLDVLKEASPKPNERCRGCGKKLLELQPG
ncbi:hypothetical protein BFW01_g10837 [Lasiodiplodia theobromae]|uniref:Uncharacterized protein n=1 Tax=Lasiodiplodia theobromae TaxID=45133 RepID=A0A8H7MAP0_9PEZI|nr:hypothetical protein BFW01_g10837 [Lasiodiplodia theobromae]